MFGSTRTTATNVKFVDRRETVLGNMVTWQIHPCYKLPNVQTALKMSTETLTYRGEARFGGGERKRRRNSCESEQSSESKRKGFLKEKAMSSLQQTHYYTLSNTRSPSSNTLFCLFFKFT